MNHTRIPAGRTRRALATAGLLVPAILASACGSGEDYANKPRPPAPVNVTANITDQRVAVSPKRLGAGPIVLIIANQSSESQEVTLETDEVASGEPGIRQKTSPLNPRGTAELKIDVPEGQYKLSVGSEDVRPAALMVEGERESAQNELLQP